MPYSATVNYHATEPCTQYRRDIDVDLGSPTLEVGEAKLVVMQSAAAGVQLQMSVRKLPGSSVWRFRLLELRFPRQFLVPGTGYISQPNILVYTVYFRRRTQAAAGQPAGAFLDPPLMEVMPLSMAGNFTFMSGGPAPSGAGGALVPGGKSGGAGLQLGPAPKVRARPR